MSALFEPIHIEAVGLANVRYFAPLNGAREFPRVSIDDLFGAVTMDRKMRRTFHSDAGHWPGSRVVRTPEGMTRIGPHSMAQGLIAAWIKLGRAPAGLEMAYRIGGAAAMDKLFPDISSSMLTSYFRDALKANGGGT